MTHHQNGFPENNPQALYVTLILDETGSMQSCKGAAITGFNQYVARLRQEPAETQFTLTLFNADKTEVRHKTVPIDQVQDLDVETHRPHDTTPLYDAIGRTLTTARQEAPAGMKKLCVILTDGLENASTEYTRKQIFALIKSCEKEGWTFIYLGADHDVWAAGEDLGIAPENLIAFSRCQIDHTFDRLSQATADFRRHGKPSNDPQGPDA